MTVKQKQLILCCFDLMAPSDVDGIWGKQTEAAARKLQKGLGITADGVFGDGTRDAAFERLRSGEPLEAEEETEKPETGLYWDHIRYWKREEFACRCGQYHAPYCNGFPVEPDQTLVELVDDIRHDFGRPAHPSSGIRCEQHNADQPNSAPNSKHKYGKALDFFIEGVSGGELLARAQADPRTNYAYIISGQYVHVDVA